MPYQQHGGSYPYASVSNQGNTKVNDYCMAVGVMRPGSAADGWSQNANGFDSPSSDSDWPNQQYSHQSPFVLVWLKWWVNLDKPLELYNDFAVCAFNITALVE